MHDPVRVEAACKRFRAFFEELRASFFERDDVLRQIALALLCREHVLLTGPPGTAKSQLATAVFGRILCEESGEPSVYARQITESTVQTDLIGPINFKNLMETGRTAHFTDEGMLGSVHAFLDEVFDGRDMLLRAALNVLEERELKEGGRTVRGRIECALMTSNRYISDVLERSRDTLLAFVDRIAFVGFVPRGFAFEGSLERVLERHVARARRTPLDALLTIQDLDVLQTLVDDVVVSEPICGALATLVGKLDDELNAAVRADPSFVPTRYLSTRTTVRSGKVLRGICVYDRIFEHPERQLQVLPEDLAWLRLHLVLGGPSASEADALLKNESQPSERRQLEILRTERELFERCLTKLPKLVVPRPSPTPSPKPSPLDAFAAKITPGDAAHLLDTLRELTPFAATGGPEAARARALLERTEAALRETAMRAVLATAPATEEPLLDVVARFAALATTLRDDSQSLHAVSRWLRDRAAAMIDEAALHAAGASAAGLQNAAEGSLDDLMKRSGKRLDTLERLAGLRAPLRDSAEAASAPEPSWLAALDAAEEDLGALWDAAFCRAVERQLDSSPSMALSQLLERLQAQLEWIDRAAARLAALRGGPSALKTRALGARLGDLVAARMRRANASDCVALVAEVERVLSALTSARLEGAVSSQQWLSCVASALTRDKPDLTEPEPPWSYDGYRALRAAEQRAPAVLSLCEVLLRVAPEGATAEAGLRAAAQLCAAIPNELREEVARRDRARIERAIGYLERWWQALCAPQISARERLEEVIRSRFFQVLWDEQALGRFALEARLLAEVLPDQADAAAKLVARLDALEERTRRGAQALLRERSDAAWANATAAG